MKSITKVLIALLLAGSVVNAQEAAKTEEKKPALDVALDIASTYLWRGYDMYRAAALQGPDQEKLFPTVASLQPSITFYAPLEGLSFNVWMAYAATNRPAKNLDTEGVKAADEIDLTLAYQFENRVGTWKPMYIMYTYPSASASSAITNSYEELGFTYTAPVFLSPTFGMYAATATGNAASKGGTYYYTLGVSHGIEAGSMTITPALMGGYWYDNVNSNNNWGHADLSVDLSFGVTDSLTLHVKPQASYRFLIDTTAGSSFPFKKEKKIVDVGTTKGQSATETVDRTAIVALVTVGAAYSF